MTGITEASALCDRELDARIDLARSLEHPALSGLLRERLRRTKARLNLAWSLDPDRTTRRHTEPSEAWIGSPYRPHPEQSFGMADRYTDSETGLPLDSEGTF